MHLHELMLILKRLFEELNLVNGACLAIATGLAHELKSVAWIEGNSVRLA